MKLIKIIFIILSVSLVTSSCMMSNGTVNTSDDIEEREYSFSTISKICASSCVIVDISPKYTQKKIKVKGPKNVLEALILKDDGMGGLSVCLHHGERFKYESENQKVHIYIASDQVSHLTSLSGAIINVTDTIRCPNHLTAEAMAGGFIRFNGVKSSTTDVKSFTGGNIILKDIISEILNAQSYTGGIISVSGNTKELHVKGDKHLLDIEELKIIN